MSRDVSNTDTSSFAPLIQVSKADAARNSPGYGSCFSKDGMQTLLSDLDTPKSYLTDLPGPPHYWAPQKCCTLQAYRQTVSKCQRSIGVRYSDRLSVLSVQHLRWDFGDDTARISGITKHDRPER